MITYAQEPLLKWRPSIEPLIPEHAAEFGDMGEFLSPNWPVYHALEQARALITITGRDPAGCVVSYLLGILHPHTNAKDITVATIPTYFVRRHPGRAFLYRTLLTIASDAAHARGAWKVYVEGSYNHAGARLLELMGAVPVSVKHVMPPHHPQEVVGHA